MNKDVDYKKERWTPVFDPSFSHLYVVSDFGRVRRLYLDYILSAAPPRGDKTRRPIVKLTNKQLGISKDYQLAYLVLASWTKVPEGLAPKYINGDNTCNELSNLTWAPSAEAYVSTGIKLDQDNVINIKKALRAGTSRRLLAKKYKVSYSTIKHIQRGRIWKSVT